MDDFIVYGALALLVPVGLIVYTVGVTRAKSSAGAIMRGVGTLCTAVLAAWAIGIAIWAQGHGSVLWLEPHALFPRALFLVVLATIPAVAATGALGERSTFFPLLAISAVLAGV